MYGKSQGFWERYGLFIIISIVFAATAAVNINVRSYGDDFFYARFMSEDLRYFIQRHKEHYYLANGRVIVHILVTFFLGINRYFWCCINSFMLAGITYFGAKISSDKVKKKEGICAAIIIGTSILCLDPMITRQSVYWLTGSFNYVYPMFLLLFYWYLLLRDIEKQRSRWVLPVLAFLSAATVEQGSLMTVGLTFLTLVELRWIQGKKINRVINITFITACVGMLTVLMAPAVLHRAAVEDAPVQGLINLIKYNIIQQGNIFLFSKMMGIYHLLTMTSALGIIRIYGRGPSLKWRWFINMVFYIGGSAYLVWLWKISVVVEYKAGSRGILLFAAAYVLVLSTAAGLVYQKTIIENRALPIIALVLCFGSQFMMIISPVYGPRNLVYGIIMLSLYTAALMPRLNDRGITATCVLMASFLFNILWLLPIVLIALSITFLGVRRRSSVYRTIGQFAAYGGLVLIGLTIFIPVLKGYAFNAVVFDHNMRLAKEYKVQQGRKNLVQIKLPMEAYAWVMPYHNPYYNPYYNLYIDVRIDEEIDWKK